VALPRGEMDAFRAFFCDLVNFKGGNSTHTR
jgi:hypothetical protein